MTTEIKKASIKEGLFLDVCYEEKQGDNMPTIVTKSCKYPLHDDLIEAFARLDSHLAILCEVITEDDISDPLLFSESYPAIEAVIQCTGFTFGGKDEHYGVTLIGRRNLKGNRVLNLVAPFTKFAEEYHPYRFISELYTDLQLCIHEVEEYLSGKQAPSNQLAFDFDGHDKMEGYE